MKTLKQNKGLLVIVSSPSGGGKDSVIAGLMKIFPGSVDFVTTTTRPPRNEEKNGDDYRFVPKEQFEDMIKNNELIEHNLYAENYYGTERAKMEEALASHPIVFSNIEVNGKRNFDKAGFKHLSIFLLPESLEILKERIVKRGGLTQEKIAARVAQAKKEIAESDIYDYRIYNRQGKLDEAVKKAAEIIRKHLPVDKKTEIS